MLLAWVLFKAIDNILLRLRAIREELAFAFHIVTRGILLVLLRLRASWLVKIVRLTAHGLTGSVLGRLRHLMMHGCDLTFHDSTGSDPTRFNLVRILGNFLEAITNSALTLIDLHAQVIFWITH